MKERPILFSGPMVRAILDGRKTMTRRVVKPQPHEGVDAVECQDQIIVGMNVPDQSGFAMMRGGVIESEAIRCPYGEPGDRLWVRETHKGWLTYQGQQVVQYAASGTKQYHVDRPEGHPEGGMLNGECCADKWRPSIHMPRWASRINLEITGVRVERLQDITDADALAEGACHPDPRAKDGCYRSAFEGLWESINGAASWDANPFVWVVEFRSVEQ